jgi:hypothetical protein
MDNAKPNALRMIGTLIAMLTLLGLGVVAVLLSVGQF